MKSVKDIENMSLEQLEAVSMDENIMVPEGFAEHMKDEVGILERLTDDEPQKAGRVRTLRIASIAAATVLLAGIGFGTAGWQNEPKDTFDDPYLAYAELEKAFARVSDGMQRGLAMVEESEAAMDKVTSIFE
ncbi:MAG: hypothetical protein IJN52_01465 [Bacteroidales bacterium]|nr:hypothetical protein [Bacteroidales bacterium]